MDWVISKRPKLCYTFALFGTLAAVAMDIIIGEWPEFGSLNFCDEYLREAATIPDTPSGMVYIQDGKPLDRPLGLFEHWNNPKERKYTKIDLQYRKTDSEKVK